MTTTNTKGRVIHFGPFEVTKQVFLITPHSFALVNLKPLVDGHVLVCPLRPHLRLTDLSPEEIADLFNAVQLTQRMLAELYFPVRGHLPSGSFTIGVQDGPGSGQTVPHVHVHVIPRKEGDGRGSPDSMYVKMASEEGNVGGALWDQANFDRPVPRGSLPRIEEEDRQARLQEDMEDEAERYKMVLKGTGMVE